MRKYFVLQMKRLLRMLPPMLLAAAVLFGCLAAIYDAVTRVEPDDTKQAKFQVGLVGTAGDTYLELGLAALETFDDSRFAVEITTMDEAQAERELIRGDIAAYVVIPEGFMEAALRGEIRPLKYVSTSGAVGLVSLFKDEVTSVIGEILAEAQKGIYGAGLAADSVGQDGNSVINRISIRYVSFILDRSKTYRVTELGISEETGLEEYLLCGFGVVLLTLICLPFAPMLVGRDPALGRMLAARGRSVFMQVCCEFTVYFGGLLAVCLPCLWLILRGGAFLAGTVPVILMVAALSFFLYELTRDLIGGVLLQFCAGLVLCFLSGCFYPVSFFPEAVRKPAELLPTGLARIRLSECLSGAVSAKVTLGLTACAVLFFGAALLLRYRKTTAVRG